MRHGAHRFLEVAEPSVLLEENDRGHGGPDEGMWVDVSSGAGAHIDHRDSEVPNKEKRSDETFGEQAMEGWFAERVYAGTEHQQGEEDEADVEGINSNRKVAEKEIDHAPDDSEDCGVANFFPGANDKKGPVFVQGEEGISLHNTCFSRR